MSFLDNGAPLSPQVQPPRFRPIVKLAMRALMSVVLTALCVGLSLVIRARAPEVQSYEATEPLVREHWRASIPLSDAIITSSGITSSGAGNLTVAGDVTISGCVHFLGGGNASPTTIGNACVSP